MSLDSRNEPLILEGRNSPTDEERRLPQYNPPADLGDIPELASALSKEAMDVMIQQSLDTQKTTFWRTFLGKLTTRRISTTESSDGGEFVARSPLKSPLTTVETKMDSYQGVEGKFRWMIAVLCSSSMAYAISFLFMISGLAYGVVNQAELFAQKIDWDVDYKVAFLGNSYLFVNDIPRLMEVMNDYHIIQNSCLHAGVSLGSLLYTGSGMYPRWQTDEAKTTQYVAEYGGAMTIYDYGLCTVAQVLEGYDANITYKNYAGTYYNDGKNPCMKVPYYLDYLNNNLINTTMDWDYVVLSDQTKRMAIEDGRNNTIKALTNVYGPMLKSNGAVPIIVDTHAFWSSNSNMTGLSDIPTFQKMISEGVEDYVIALKKILPSRQKPIVCPVGVAYLVIWEEDQDLWEKLFLDDSVHSSIYGSYLFALVLSTTIFGHLPSMETSVPERMEYLFATSRRLVGNDMNYPSYAEAMYMREVTARVVLKKYVPSSLRS